MSLNAPKMIGLVAVLIIAPLTAAVAAGGVAYAALRAVGRVPHIVSAQGLDPDAGIVIVEVEPGGPAGQAGVTRGDILLSMNGESIDSTRTLMEGLSHLAPGDQIQLAVLHGDDERTITATVGDRDGQAYLGLTPCADLSRVSRAAVNLRGFGAIITEVTPNSPAEASGLRSGDRIVSVDGRTLDAENTLSDLIGAHAPGDTVTLVVAEPGDTDSELTVTLGEQSGQAGKPYLGVQYLSLPDGLPPMQMPERFREFRGMPFSEAPVEAGVRIQRVVEGSPAEAAGLQPGDVLTAVDGTSLDRPSALVAAISEHQPGDTVSLTVTAAKGSEQREARVKLAEDPEREGRAYLGVEMGGFSMRLRPGRLSAVPGVGDSEDRTLRLRLPFMRRPLELNWGRVLSRLAAHLPPWLPGARTSGASGGNT